MNEPRCRECDYMRFVNYEQMRCDHPGSPLGGSRWSVSMIDAPMGCPLRERSKTMKPNIRRIIEQVQRVDKEAAEYLEKEGESLPGFNEGADRLIGLMYWGQTEQGHAFWKRIDRLIEKQPLLKTEDAQALAEAHWKYVEGVLRAAGKPEADIEEIGYHYRTAMIHGYKHGLAR